MTGRPATVLSGQQTSPWRYRLRWAVVTAAGAVVLFFCALREAKAMSVQADGASIVLEAGAMLHGNVLLHGWYLADVSFYTTELPEYMLVVLAHGMRPGVVPVCAALTYTLLVLLAAFVARGQARGREGVARVAITVAIMLGPALPAAQVLITDPDHTGTTVPVLVALALIDRGIKDRGRESSSPWTPRNLWVPAGVAAVLGWALVGDPLVLLIGVVPLLVVCGTRAFTLLARRRLPPCDAWCELSPAATALAAVAGAWVFSHVISAAGGFTVESSGQARFVSAGSMAKNVWAVAGDFLNLFSADFFGMKIGAGLVPTGIHLVAAAAVVAATVAGLRRLSRGADLVAPLLATAIVVDVAAYALTYQASVPTNREIAPAFALGAALAGRLLAGPLIRERLEFVLVAGVAAAVFAASSPLLLAAPLPPRESSLASWLEHRGLRQGIAGYWQANSVTLDSGGLVTMRPVRQYAHGLAPYRWELNKALLDSRTSDVNFLVATAPDTQAGSTVTAAEATARFGPAYRTYRYKQYTILVWRKNLLPELTGT